MGLPAYVKTVAEIRGGSARRKEALVRGSGTIPESHLGPELPAHVRRVSDLESAVEETGDPGRALDDWHYDPAPVTHAMIDGEEVPVTHVQDPATGEVRRDPFQARDSGIIEGMISDPALAGAANPFGVQQAGARLTQDEPERDAMLEMLAAQGQDPAYRGGQAAAELLGGGVSGAAVGPGLGRQVALAGAEEGFRGGAETGTVGGALARGAVGAGVGAVGGAITNPGAIAESLGRSGGRAMRGFREGLDEHHSIIGPFGSVKKPPAVLDDAVDSELGWWERQGTARELASAREERIRQRALEIGRERATGTPTGEGSMARSMGFDTEEQLQAHLAPPANPIFRPSSAAEKEVRAMQAAQAAERDARMLAGGADPAGFGDTGIPGASDLDRGVKEAIGGIGTVPSRGQAMVERQGGFPGPGMSPRMRQQMEAKQDQLRRGAEGAESATVVDAPARGAAELAPIGEDPAEAGMRMLAEADFAPPPTPGPSALERAGAAGRGVVDTGTAQRFAGRDLSRPAGEMATPLVEQMTPEYGLSGAFSSLTVPESTPRSADPSARSSSIADAMSSVVERVRELAPELYERVVQISSGLVADPVEIASVSAQLNTVPGLNWSWVNPMRQEPEQ